MGIGEVKGKQNPRPLQTLYNTAVHKISCGAKTSMAIVGDPHQLNLNAKVEDPQTDFNMEIVPPDQEENFDEDMIEHSQINMLNDIV